LPPRLFTLTHLRRCRFRWIPPALFAVPVVLLRRIHTLHPRCRCGSTSFGSFRLYNFTAHLLVVLLHYRTGMHHTCGYAFHTTHCHLHVTGTLLRFAVPTRAVDFTAHTTYRLHAGGALPHGPSTPTARSRGSTVCVTTATHHHPRFR